MISSLFVCIFSIKFLFHMKNVSMCNSQCWDGPPSGRVIVRRGKNFNIAIFLNTVHMINVKVCQMVLLAELFFSYHLKVTGVSVLTGDFTFSSSPDVILCG